MDKENNPITDITYPINECLTLPSVTVLLFDLDGTLTPARQSIEQTMVDCLSDIRDKHRSHVKICVVSGSDFTKIKEQMGQSIDLCDIIFGENGCTE